MTMNKTGPSSTFPQQQQMDTSPWRGSGEDNNLWEDTISNQGNPNFRNLPYVSGSQFEILAKDQVENKDDHGKITDEDFATINHNEGNPVDNRETIMGENRRPLETVDDAKVPNQPTLTQAIL